MERENHKEEEEEENSPVANTLSSQRRGPWFRPWSVNLIINN